MRFGLLVRGARSALCLLLMALTSRGALPQLVPKPLFKTAPPEHRQFVIERIYNYTKMRYDPPVTVKPVGQATASYSTPDEAFIAQMSAMLAGNYDWYISGWTEESQKSIEDRNRTAHLSPATIQASWQTNLKGKQIRLVGRVETGPYVLLEYRLVAAGGQEEAYLGLIPFRLVGKRWLATQELMADEFFQHYGEAKDKITEVVR